MFGFGKKEKTKEQELDGPDRFEKALAEQAKIPATERNCAHYDGKAGRCWELNIRHAECRGQHSYGCPHWRARSD